MTDKGAKRARDRRAAKAYRDRRRRGAVRVAFAVTPGRLAELAASGYLDSAAKITSKTATVAIEAFHADHLPT